MRRIGSMAQLDYFSMQLAEQMQALSMQYIQDAFYAEEDIGLDNLTHALFLKEMEKAKEGGPIAENEFNRMLSKIIQGVVPMITNPPPQEGQ